MSIDSNSITDIGILNDFQDFLTAETQRAQRTENEDLASYLGAIYSVVGL
jgi:hypothetical protein